VHCAATETVERLTYAVALLAFVCALLVLVVLYQRARLRGEARRWQDRDRDSDAARVERMRVLGEVAEEIERLRRLDD
jgi:heme exporter protein D